MLASKKIKGICKNKMTPEENKQIAELMRSEKERARGYADYFGWSINRDLEEMNVVKQLAIGLEKDNKLFFSNIQARGRPNDPPDCEAVIGNNERIAIEVTELVDGNAIRAFKAGATYEWAEWDKKKFLSSIEEAITSKDSRFPMLKGAPYPGGYIVVIYTDEPDLNQ